MSKVLKVTKLSIFLGNFTVSSGTQNHIVKYRVKNGGRHRRKENTEDRDTNSLEAKGRYYMVNAEKGKERMKKGKTEE